MDINLKKDTNYTIDAIVKCKPMSLIKFGYGRYKTSASYFHADNKFGTINDLVDMEFFDLINNLNNIDNLDCHVEKFIFTEKK